MVKFTSILKKMQYIFLKIERAVFGLLMAGVLIATLLLDKNLKNNPFPNEANWSNGGYYLFAFIFLLLLVWIYQTNFNHRVFSNRIFYILIGCIAGIVFIFQCSIACWMPQLTGGDFESVRLMAINLAKGGTFAENTYFIVAPNNVNIAILFSLVYRLTSSWTSIIIMGAFFTNLSVVLAALIVYRLTQNKFVTITICILGEILIALTWRAYLAYTDNWGMPFAIALIYLYLSKLKKEIKIPSILALGMFGAWIKITILIPLLGIIIFSLLKIMLLSANGLKEKRSSLLYKSLIPILCIAILGGAVR